MKSGKNSRLLKRIKIAVFSSDPDALTEKDHALLRLDDKNESGKSILIAGLLNKTINSMPVMDQTVSHNADLSL